MYKIVRHFANGKRETMEENLSLEEAQAWCNDINSSSKTATNADSYTAHHGEWFDGYDIE